MASCNFICVACKFAYARECTYAKNLGNNYWKFVYGDNSRTQKKQRRKFCLIFFRISFPVLVASKNDNVPDILLTSETSDFKVFATFATSVYCTLIKQQNKLQKRSFDKSRYLAVEVIRKDTGLYYIFSKGRCVFVWIIILLSQNLAKTNWL